MYKSLLQHVQILEKIIVLEQKNIDYLMNVGEEKEKKIGDRKERGSGKEKERKIIIRLRVGEIIKRKIER
jgi:hypothetical protein